jgi:hypothetical protein
MCNKNSPWGVVVSICSVNERKAIPRFLRSVTVVRRCGSDLNQVDPTSSRMGMSLLPVSQIRIEDGRAHLRIRAQDPLDSACPQPEVPWSALERAAALSSPEIVLHLLGRPPKAVATSR